MTVAEILAEAAHNSDLVDRWVGWVSAIIAVPVAVVMICEWLA